MNELDNEYRAILGLCPIYSENRKIEKPPKKKIPIKNCIIFIGKYKGRKYVELPKSYLGWIIQSDLSDDIKYNARRALASIKSKEKNT